MSGGSAVKAAVGRGVSPVCSDHREENRGTPRGARRGWLDRQGAAGPALKTEGSQPKDGRFILREGSLPNGRDATRLGKRRPCGARSTRSGLKPGALRRFAKCSRNGLFELWN